MRIFHYSLPLALAMALGSATVAAGELLVDHVDGYTLDGAGKLRRFEAMLVADGKVVATGSHAELVRKAGKAEVRIGVVGVLVVLAAQADVGAVSEFDHARCANSLKDPRSGRQRPCPGAVRA